ncbi:MAG: hypothetical protein K2P87_09415 [Lachnospiraceae bacterium]|nr:hypothetical protein [Lachnospiraceae bacterium]
MKFPEWERGGGLRDIAGELFLAVAGRKNAGLAQWGAMKGKAHKNTGWIGLLPGIASVSRIILCKIEVVIYKSL